MAMARTSRRLFLHLSALSDVEYGVYREALHDLLDDQSREVSDDELEMRRVGAREVRAWMKGRFRDLSVADINNVLHMFTSQISDTDEFTGGQLLAALRLLMHARRGEEIGEAGVFIQAEPSSPTEPYPSPFSTRSSKSDTVEEERPSRTQSSPLDHRELVPHADTVQRPPTSERSSMISRPPATSTSGSSISKRASLPSSAPLVPLSKPSSGTSEVMTVAAGSMNPFLQRAKTHTGSIHVGSTESKIPPLPPRKPLYMSTQGLSTIPLLSREPGVSLHAWSSLTASLSNHSISSSSATAISLPSPPQPVPQSYVSLLGRQSRGSSKTATAGGTKTQTDRDRILQSTRTSVDSARDRIKNASRSPDKGHRRRPPRPPSPKSERPTTSASIETQNSSVSEQDVRYSTPSSLSKRHSSDGFNASSTLSGSDNEGAKEFEGSRALSASEQYAAPPLHPARRSSIHVNSVHTTSPNVQQVRHSRSPSFHVSSNSAQKAKHTPSPIHTRTISSSSSPSPSRSPNSPNSGGTATQRTARSYSMMHASTTGPASGRLSPLLPPPRRKRPESMQLTSRASRIQDTDNRTSINTISNAITNAFERRATATGEPPSPVHSGFGAKQEQERDPSPSTSSAGVSASSFSFAQLQKTFSALQQRAQPTLDRVRYKAEAGLAPRRGYVVPNSRVDLPAHLQYLGGDSAGDRLMPRKSRSDDDSNAFDLDSGNESVRRGGARGLSLDSDEDDDAKFDEREGGRTSMTADTIDREVTVRGRQGRSQYAQERDNLKLPEGEGWTLLR